MTSAFAGETPSPDEVERRLDRLERDFYRVYGEDPVELDTIVPAARATGDPALVGRAFCLLARAQIGRGRHDLAIEAARAGLAAFAELAEMPARANAPTRAELLRTCGNALLKLGRNGEALPILEEAVATADDAFAHPLDGTARQRALHALIRSLSNLGSALFAVREVDTAIAMYRRAVAAADAGGADSTLIDDVLLAQWNLIDALHERVRHERRAGDPERAAADLAAARDVLDRAGRQLTAPSLPADAVTGYGRQGYFASFGQHLLLMDRPAEAAQMFERQIGAVAHEPASGMFEWVHAVANAGLAHAALALDRPLDALRHCDLALARFDRHDEASERAPVLLVRATALRRLGEHAAAFEALEAHYAVRAQLEEEAAQRHARHVAARLGLERARTETESHRQMAATLETLGRIGQEITANLDREAVVRILHRHVGALMHAPAFAVWLLDETAQVLSLAFGVEDGEPLRSPPVRLDHPTAWIARAVRERTELAAQAADLGPLPATQAAGTRFMQSVMFAPLVAGERVLGGLSVQSDRVAAYGENERAILRTLCTYAAIALDNAAAYRELARAVASLQLAQRELTLRTAEYERLSMTDSLTGVANRRHFIERARIELAEARRSGGPLAVAIFDIDHFKAVNDRYGHVAGDRVLQQIAQVGKDGLRSGDFLARVGGEEFALLLPGAGPVEAVAIAERIRSAIESAAILVDGNALPMTASFGVANVGIAAEAFDDAFARADGALYRSKQDGRNRVTAAS